MKKELIFILIITAIISSSCYYDKEELLYPVLANSCDTTDVGYAKSITPILSNLCLQCHGNSNAAVNGANIKLEDYSDVKTYVDNGKLYGSISHGAGYSAMPKGAAKFDDCKIKLFNLWIENGAENN